MPPGICFSSSDLSIATHSVTIISSAIDAFEPRRVRNLGRVDDPGLDPVAVLLSRRRDDSRISFGNPSALVLPSGLTDGISARDGGRT